MKRLRMAAAKAMLTDISKKIDEGDDLNYADERGATAVSSCVAFSVYTSAVYGFPTCVDAWICVL